MMTEKEIFDFINAEWYRESLYTLQLIGIGSKGHTASNTLYNKYKDEEDTNKLITINLETDDILIDSKSKSADLLAVITELDNQNFYKTSIQIAEQYSKALLRICVTSSTPDSYNLEELKKYYDIIIHTVSSTDAMYRPVETMMCEMCGGCNCGVAFEDLLFMPHRTRVMFHIEKSYSDLNDVITNMHQVKNAMSKNISPASTYSILIMHLPDDAGLHELNEITIKFFDMMGYKSSSDFLMQAHLYESDIKNIKISILYGEAIKDNEENSDTI